MQQNVRTWNRNADIDNTYYWKKLGTGLTLSFPPEHQSIGFTSLICLKPNSCFLSPNQCLLLLRPEVAPLSSHSPQTAVASSVLNLSSSQGPSHRMISRKAFFPPYKAYFSSSEPYYLSPELLQWLQESPWTHILVSLHLAIPIINIGLSVSP